MGSKAIKFRNKNNDYIYPCPYFPVGSIYLSLSTTNPSTYFGGTWELIKDRFLIGAGGSYNVNTTGGSASHNHGYRVGFHPYYGVLIGEDNNAISLYDYESGEWKNGATDSGVPDTGVGNTCINSASKSQSSAKYSVYAKTTNTNSLPPYLAVYMWRRTA